MTIYYVDATNGSDSYDGLTESTAWQTTNAVNNVVLVPGDSVLFKADEEWRTNTYPIILSYSGEEGSFITIGSYGIGNKPILNGGFNRASSSLWTLDTGSIWVTGGFPDIVGSELFVNPSFDTDTGSWSWYSTGSFSGGFARTTGSYDTSPAGGRIYCTRGGIGTSDVQLYPTGFNVQAGKLYKLTYRAKCDIPFTITDIYLMKKNSPYTSYFSQKWFSTPLIGSEWNTYTTLFKCNTTDTDARITFYLGGSPSSGLLGGSFFFDTFSFKECDTSIDLLKTDVGNMIFNKEEIFGSKIWTEAGLNVQGNYYYNGSTWQLKIYSISNPGSYYNDIELVMYDNIITIGGKSYIDIYNIHFKNGGQMAISMSSNTGSILIHDNYFSYIGGAQQYGIVRFGNAVQWWNAAHDCIAERNIFWQTYDAAITPQGNGSQAFRRIFIRNNIFINNEYSLEFWNRDSSAISDSIYFENNTCIYAGSVWSHSQRQDPNGRHLSFYSNTSQTSNFFIRNNIFYGATDSIMRLWNIWLIPGSNCIMDYNCYYDDVLGGSFIRLEFLTDKNWNYSRFAEWQGSYNQDLHSIIVNPLMKNPLSSNCGSYDLLNTSPCIDSGFSTNVVLEDFIRVIRPKNGIYDIGAFEYINNLIKGDKPMLIGTVSQNLVKLQNNSNTKPSLIVSIKY